ncbi:hypothetical protein KR044_009394 [Drosophila immigrans]|nr:hypothetical protein KR044_009394 [Drosophila immigrans]
MLKNLTDNTRLEINQYLDRLVTDCNTEIGLCEPLAYIYYRSVHDICNRLVDPINGYWLGLLPCILLMLPAALIAHRLICLFKKHAFSGRTHYAEMGHACPVCMGLGMAPMVPHSVGLASPNQRQDAGQDEILTSVETSIEPETDHAALNKRKQD